MSGAVARPPAPSVRARLAPFGHIRAAAMWARLTDARAPRGRREYGVYALLLAVLAGFVYASHIRHGGFLMDDWSNAAKSRYLASCCWLGQTGNGGAGWPAQFHNMLSDGPAAYHLGLPVVVPVAHFLFGVHLGLHLALAVVLAVAMSVAAYAVMRTLGLAPLHAGAIAALALLFPWSDSLRLWAMAGFNQIAPLLWVGGLFLALRGLRATSWRAAAGWHAAALVAYAVSILMYELAAGLVLLGAFFYLWRGSWRAALVRWVPDVIVAVLASNYVLHHTLPRAVATWPERFNHARAIGDQALTLLARATIPFGAPMRGLIDAIVLLVLAAGVATWLLAPAGDPLRATARRWAVTGIAGLVVVAAGYLLILPATYGAPLDAGIENRVNMVAAFGFVLIVYAAAMLAGTLLAARLRRPLSLATALPLLLAVVMAAGYIGQTREHARWYDSAFQQGQAALGGVSKAFAGHPPRASIIYMFGFSTFQAPGIPVFSWVWDVPGALKVTFQDPSIAGFAILPGTTWHCGKSGGLFPESPFGTGVGMGGPYGHSYFVDVSTGRKMLIRNRADCVKGRQSFQPAPLKAGTDCALVGGGPASRLAWSCPERVWRRAANAPAS